MLLDRISEGTSRRKGFGLVIVAMFVVLSNPHCLAATDIGDTSCAGFAASMQPIEKEQRVQVKEVFASYTIELFNTGEEVGNWVVMEIGECHVALMDIAGASDLYIPASSLRSVTWVRMPVDPERTRYLNLVR